MGERVDPWQAVETRQRVEARYAVGDEVHGVGRVIAYYEAPTFLIEREDGTRFSWRGDLTFAADGQEEGQ